MRKIIRSRPMMEALPSMILMSAVPPIVQTISVPAYDPSISSPVNFYSHTATFVPPAGSIESVDLTFSNVVSPTLQSSNGIDPRLSIYGAGTDIVSSTDTVAIAAGGSSASSTVATSHTWTTPANGQWNDVGGFADSLPVTMHFTLTGDAARNFSSVLITNDGRTNERFSGSANVSWHEAWNMPVVGETVTAQFNFVQPLAATTTRLAKAHGRSLGLIPQAFKLAADVLA